MAGCFLASHCVRGALDRLPSFSIALVRLPGQAGLGAADLALNVLTLAW